MVRVHCRTSRADGRRWRARRGCHRQLLCRLGRAGLPTRHAETFVWAVGLVGVLYA